MRKYSIAMPEINKLPRIGGCNCIDGKLEWPYWPYWPDELERPWWPDKSFPPDRIQERWWENCQICEISEIAPLKNTKFYVRLILSGFLSTLFNFYHLITGLGNQSISHFPEEMVKPWLSWTPFSFEIASNPVYQNDGKTLPSVEWVSG